MALRLKGLSEDIKKPAEQCQGSEYWLVQALGAVARVKMTSEDQIVEGAKTAVLGISSARLRT